MQRSVWHGFERKLYLIIPIIQEIKMYSLLIKYCILLKKFVSFKRGHILQKSRHPVTYLYISELRGWERSWWKHSDVYEDRRHRINLWSQDRVVESGSRESLQHLQHKHPLHKLRRLSYVVLGCTYIQNSDSSTACLNFKKKYITIVIMYFPN